MSDPLNVYLGIKSQTLVAAFCGGAAAALFSGGGLALRLTTFLIGLFTAVYGTPFTINVVEKFTTVTGNDLERGAAFFTGVGGMIIVSGVYAVMIAWKNKMIETITGKKEKPDAS